MGKKTEELLKEAISAYPFIKEIKEIERNETGHINDTFVVKAGDGRSYIMQRINDFVFKNPREVMENIIGVTQFLREVIVASGGDPERETLNVMLTETGDPLFTDSEGGAWRCFKLIEDIVCLEHASSTKQFRSCARSFGGFLRRLESYPAETLHETIPDFHNTPARLAALKRAVEADVMGRRSEAAAEIDFILSREDECGYFTTRLASGEIPLRVTHNDTKFNNILIDKASGEGVCIIDLDTIMPGSALYDFGDAIRSGANRAEEDERELSKVALNLELFEAYTRGYLEAAGEALTEAEIDALPWGAKIITLECGARFLTDHLEGDHYFKTSREGHNLDRARTQLALVADMEKNWDKMLAIVEKHGPGRL
ncbi:MAG: aminoglycoside phosphotransferase family protein [Oscillospiraceae bacterium]|nr:aminoglycoside phosphotransferase family protein [Oscillospiraceae bacterium]